MSKSHRSMRSHALRFACLVVAVGFVEGFFAARLYAIGSTFEDKVPFVLVDTFLVFVWYRNDSIARSFWPSRYLSIALAGATIVAMPYYLFQTRGFQSGLKSSGLFILILMAYGIWVAAVEITVLKLSA